MIRYGDKSVPLASQIFVCVFVPGTEVGPGDDFVDVEGGVVAAIVVVRIDVDDLVACLCQRACGGEYRKKPKQIKDGRSED